jgi:hypothetical protein
MNRVETLIQKLQEQFKSGATPQQLLLTVQLLHQELVLARATAPQVQPLVSILAPVMVKPPALAEETNAPVVMPEIAPPVEEEKIIEVLQVDEAELEAELEEIKRNAAAIQQITTKSRPQLLFDLADDEIPTLPPRPAPEVAATKEINELVADTSKSLNDLHREPKTEISDKLSDVPVKDLKKAIGVNDRFLYIKELFRGDEAMYERSIKTINSFSIWPEAEYWIRRELKTKLGWVDSEPVVMQFDQLVKRRFA